MNTQVIQKTKMQIHNVAIRTTAAFSGLALETVIAEFKKRMYV